MECLGLEHAVKYAIIVEQATDTTCAISDRCVTESAEVGPGIDAWCCVGLPLSDTILYHSIIWCSRVTFDLLIQQRVLLRSRRIVVDSLHPPS